MKGTAKVFILLIRFLLYSFVLSSFLVLLRYSFLILSFISTRLMESASNILKSLLVSFSPSVLIFSWFGSSIPSIRCCCFPLFIISKAHFKMPNSIPTSWLYILTACIRVSNSFSFFATQFDIVHVHSVIDLFQWFSKFLSGCVISEYVVGWHHCYYE